MNHEVRKKQSTYLRPYPSGNQCISMKGSAILQQQIYLAAGDHTYSFYSAIISSQTDLNILLSSSLAAGTLLNAVPITLGTWTYFAFSFNVATSDLYYFQIQGLSDGVAIDLITVQ